MIQFSSTSATLSSSLSAAAAAAATATITTDAFKRFAIQERWHRYPYPSIVAKGVGVISLHKEPFLLKKLSL